ncbi:MAG: cytochrome c biogenesis protein CcdA [Chthoniobacteraceae bacterium]
MRTHILRTVALFPMLASAPAAHAAGPLSAVNSWIESGLNSSHGSWLSYGFLLLGGILASLLPCVYPLYPITATIVASRSAGAKLRWLHPLAYYGGLASMYSLLGFIAGASGGAFNAAMRMPAVNLSLAVIFLILALATAGFLHLDVFGARQIGEAKPGLAGTIFMGMAAGFLSSACVGPFVVSILIGIASTAEHFAIGAALLAGVKMLAFGLGVGVPFLLIGLGGARLPRSGAWMRYVQWALIAYFSFVYLEKGLSGFGFAEGTIQLIFTSALLFLFAAYKLQPESAGFERLPRALYALLAVITALSLARGLLPAPQIAPATAVAAESGPAMERHGNLAWYMKREDAFAAAKRAGKPVFVDFFGSWCANCKEFEALTQSHQQLNAGLAGAVLLRVQDTVPEFKEWQNDRRFPELKVGLPFLVILDADGNLLFKTSDYTRIDEMLLFLQG